tara:strand:+ start:369 stop:725 length:357 start_codon:yes stop_codon:yes gene_type:complete
MSNYHKEQEGATVDHNDEQLAHKYEYPCQSVSARKFKSVRYIQQEPIPSRVTEVITRDRHLRVGCFAHVLGMFINNSYDTVTTADAGFFYTVISLSLYGNLGDILEYELNDLTNANQG